MNTLPLSFRFCFFSVKKNSIVVAVTGKGYIKRDGIVLVVVTVIQLVVEVVVVGGS
jgi:hypothetical protein